LQVLLRVLLSLPLAVLVPKGALVVAAAVRVDNPVIPVDQSDNHTPIGLDYH
jgi:hypothetical protein